MRLRPSLICAALLAAALMGCAGKGRGLDPAALQPPPAPASFSEQASSPLLPDHLALARDLVRQGHYEVAVRQLREAIALDGGTAEPHCLLGICLRETGDLPGAEAAFRQAVDLDPDYAPAHNGLGITLFQMQRHPPAHCALEKAVALNPASPEFQNNLGVFEMRMGRLEPARSRFIQCLRLAPGDARARNNLAECLVRMGREGTALDLLERHLPAAAACNNIGALYLAVGRREEARRMFQKALDQDPGLAAARRNLNRMAEEKEAIP